MIKSRPPLQSATVAGKGPYTINMTYESLELIGALVSLVKLGHHNKHRRAAYELFEALEELTNDCDFSCDALERVQPVFEIHDADTYDVLDQRSHNEVAIVL